MYTPRHFVVDDRDEIVAMVRASGFGHVVIATDGGFDSAPVPFLVDDELGSVRAHVARSNPVWKAAPCEALLIVAGRDGYVSPSWYPSKADDGKVVPTWNYEVVHLHGRLSAHDDPAWVARQIRDLTDLNEVTMPLPWSVDDPPDGYVDQLQRGVVGVELRVSRVEAKQKVSQNRSDRDRAAVRTALGWP